jgi:hypothetical protein
MCAPPTGKSRKPAGRRKLGQARSPHHVNSTYNALTIEVIQLES